MSEAPPPPPPPRESTPPPPPPPSPVAPAGKRGMRDKVGLPYIEWKPLTVLFGVLTAIGIMFMGTIPIAIADPELESAAAKNLTQFVFGAALVLAALIFATVDAGGKVREGLRRLGFRDFRVQLLGMAVIGWLIYLAFLIALTPLLSPEQQDVTKEIGGDDGSALNMVVVGLLVVVVAPFAEEVFFRGFMFAGLRRSMPIWPAAIISGAVWGSLHLTGGNIGVVVLLSIFGVILAHLYERSGSLWAPIVCHGINNALAFVVLTTS